MLNINENTLKITNPKLYHSPYKNNIIKVGEVLNEFKLRSRLIYLQNLKTLKIELVMDEKINEYSPKSKAIYDNYLNTILIRDGYNSDEEINHELFHCSSNKKSNKLKRRSGIVICDKYKILGKYLNEGITEYLNLKSNKENTSTSGYQLELFTIEVLSFIYGEEFINYYFQNNGTKFLNYFGENKKVIMKIDKLLNENFIYKEIHSNRLRYLYVSLLLQKEISIDETFELNIANNKKTHEKLLTLYEEINKDEKYEKVNLLKLILRDEFSTDIYSYWTLEYYNKKNIIFKQILDYLLKIAYYEGYKESEIKQFIFKSLENKSYKFQKMYSQTLMETFNKPKTKIKIR